MTMNVEFLYRKKIPVAILGATGVVGKHFVYLLQDHPWFRIESLIASKNSSGKCYGDLIEWEFDVELKKEVAALPVTTLDSSPDASILFSSLDADVAKDAELAFAEKGYVVISNSSAFRMDERVPLIVPEVNPSHLELLKENPFGERGTIVTNPNCSVIGLVMALASLEEHYGIEAVSVHTLQALSGAGRSGQSLDVEDNVIPHIPNEESKIETEPLKILGTYLDGKIDLKQFKVSAQVNRVNVTHGHLENVAVKLKRPAKRDEIIDGWNHFKGEPQALELPTAPLHPIRYLEDVDSPQPKRHRDEGNGMTLTIGGLRECSLMDWKFSILSHNVFRGAAGTAVLNAELLVKRGDIFW